MRTLTTSTTGNHLRRRAFTFIEVIVALAIVGIAFTALLTLHLTSINLTDAAQNTFNATLLADARLDETLACDHPTTGTAAGTTAEPTEMQWSRKIEKLHLSGFNQNDLTGLRAVTVTVRWRHGTKDKHIEMLTYIADRNLP